MEKEKLKIAKTIPCSKRISKAITTPGFKLYYRNIEKQKTKQNTPHGIVIKRDRLINGFELKSQKLVLRSILLTAFSHRA